QVSLGRHVAFRTRAVQSAESQDHAPAPASAEPRDVTLAVNGGAAYLLHVLGQRRRLVDRSGRWVDEREAREHEALHPGSERGVDEDPGRLTAQPVVLEPRLAPSLGFLWRDVRGQVQYSRGSAHM